MGRSVFASLVMTALMVMGSAALAPAAVLYVDNTPGGAGTMAWVAPYTTIQAAINASAPGDEIWVAAGTYVENIRMGQPIGGPSGPGNGVAVYGGFHGTETQRTQRNVFLYPTIIDGNATSAAVHISYCPDPRTRVDGFTLTNGSGFFRPDTYYAYGGGVFAYGSAATIANCRIINNSGFMGGGLYVEHAQAGMSIVGNQVLWNQAGHGGGGMLFAYSETPTLISKNRIEGNSASPWGGGIQTLEDPSVISQNVIIRNSTNDLNGESAGGIHVDRYSNVQILNNLIAWNTNPTGAGGIMVFHHGYNQPGPAFATLSNNIVARNVGTGLQMGSIEDSAFLSCNDVWGNDGADYLGIAPGAGDISADPMLAMGGTDIHLTPGSPCINAGDTGWYLSSEIVTDIDGDRRVMESAVDIGADETDFTPPVTTATPTGTLGENGWYRSPVTLSLSATDNGGVGVKSTKYAYASTGIFLTYTAPLSITSQGPRTVYYFSTDLDNNFEAVKSGTIFIDTIAPTVTATFPIEAQQNVARGATIAFTFTEDVFQTADLGTLVTIRDSNGLPYTLTYTLSGNRLVLDPTGLLGRRLNHTVTLPAGCVKDKAGNSLASPYALLFKTANN